MYLIKNMSWWVKGKRRHIYRHKHKLCCEEPWYDVMFHETFLTCCFDVHDTNIRRQWYICQIICLRRVNAASKLFPTSQNSTSIIDNVALTQHQKWLRNIKRRVILTSHRSSCFCSIQMRINRSTCHCVLLLVDIGCKYEGYVD